MPASPTRRGTRALLEPGTTVYLQIPPWALDAQKGLLRLWLSTLIRMIGSSGSEEKSEVLLLCDEAEALSGLAVLNEALIRGRSSGVRMLIVYQSDSKVRTYFQSKPTLLYDNCSTLIFLGASSLETAEQISKMLGSYTQVLDNYGTNYSRSGCTEGSGGTQVSRGSSMNHSHGERALLRPEEVLRLSDDYLIAFQQGLPSPILGLRIRWYADRFFNPVAKKRGSEFPRWKWALIAVSVIAVGFLLGRAKYYGYGYWQPEPQLKRR